MPSINNLKLSIGAGNTSTRKRVTVEYQLRFTSAEIMDSTVFSEKVTLRGDDPIWDDHLQTLINQCTRAQSGAIDRQIVRQVSRSVLDEDPDTVILGIVIGNIDEVYAQVTLTPFKPSSRQRNSNIVKAHFGQAGS